MARLGGAGRLRRARHLNAEVNIINLVDVILVLLVIFMITAPIMTGGVQVQLPKSVVGPVDATDAVAITIDRDGRIAIGDSPKRMSLAVFRTFFPVYLANNHPKTANIKSDARADVGTLTLVMGVLSEAKLPIGIIAEPMKP